LSLKLAKFPQDFGCEYWGNCRNLRHRNISLRR
jgi:hypothetical protein